MNKHTSNYSLNAVLFMLGLIAVLLLLQAIVRYSDFVNSQQALMENEVEIGGKEIERFIKELHNEVAIFAEEKYEIINFLAAYPESEEISKHLLEKVEGLFPDYIAVTISDENALPRYFSGKNNSDIACLNDITTFLETGKHSDISIHAYNDEYHFDVMSVWGRTRTRGILIISFKPEIISRSLQISEAAGHKLILLHKDKPGLIEVSTAGARNHPVVHGIDRLQEESQTRIGARYDIKGANWQLVALPAKDLYHDQLQFISIQTITVMFAIAIVSFTMLRTIRRAEHQRKKSQTELFAAKEHLQQALDFSEVFMCRWDVKTDSLIWSDNAEQLFTGIAPAYFNSYLQMLDKADRDEFRSRIDTCLNTNEPYQHEHKIRLQGGSERWLEMSGNFEVNSQNGHIEMISLVTDITERKQAEDRRIQAEKKQHDTLVREVHHRIKNHLQGVVGLLRQHTINNPEISDVIDMAVGQLHSVSTVYGLQSRELKAQVGMHELMVEICKANKGMLGTEINYTASDDARGNISLGEERAVAIALVINELLTNAIKHASTVSRMPVAVHMQVEKDKVSITIKNDIDESPADFDYETGRGLGTGLTLIRSLLPGKGARLTIKPENGCMRAVLLLWSPVVRNET